MSGSGDNEQIDQPPSSRCAECSAPLAPDQRYCVQCGARRGPMTAPAAELVAAMVPQDADAAVAADAAEAADGPGMDAEGQPDGAPDTDGEQAPADLISRLSPRAAAIAVMAMLAFGTLVGSLVGSSEASTPIVVAYSPGQTSTSPASDLSATNAGSGADNSGGSGGGGGGGSGGGITTITETTPAATTTVAGGSTSTPNDSGSSTGTSLPPVKHVFLIVLSDNGYNETFGPGAAHSYLDSTLARQGELVENYYAVTSGELANAVALISGQGPTQQTAINCPTFTNVGPGTIGKEAQILGTGCVYPTTATTVADQLTANGESWKAYLEDIGNGPAGTPKTCRHPALGAADADQSPVPGDAYVTWSNPFVYFHSVIDVPTCGQSDVGLNQLATDLKKAPSTPTFSYIVPNRCHDGGQLPCAPGAPAGATTANGFLRSVVPEIEHSAAYKAGGLIAITFDQAPQTGADADPSGCCDNPTYPNLPVSGTGTTTTGASTTPAGTSTTPAGTSGMTTSPTPTTSPTTTPATTTGAATTGTTTPTTTTPTTPALGGGQVNPTGGGGQVGLLLISPYVKPNSQDVIDYFNHFSLLRSVENLFNLGHLGYATDPQLSAFGNSVYNNYTAGQAASAAAASSRRSSPQNSCSPTSTVGTPSTPLDAASSVCSLSRSLISWLASPARTASRSKPAR